MEIPRSGYWGLALFWALVPGLSGPSARADERERRATPPNHHAIARHPSTVVHPVDEIEEDQPPGELSAEQRARVILACTMVLSEGYMTPPPDYPPPMVTKTPELPPHTETFPPGDQPPPKTVPEPASLVSGLCGAALALLAWRRKRRRQPEAEATEGPGELALEA